MSPDPLELSLGRVPEHVEAQVRRTPGATAVIAGTERLSYAQLDRLANRIAVRLRTLGIPDDGLVGVCLPRDRWLVPGLLGVLKAGAGYVPLDPAYPPSRLRLIAEDARMDLVLATSATLAAASGMGPAPVLVDDLPDAGAVDVPVPGRPDDLAYVLFTSGSTGRPKGAAIEHRNALAFLAWAASAYTAQELAGSLAAASICFDLSILEIFVPLVIGGTVIVADNLLALPRLPARDEVTMLTGVPSAVAALLEAPLPAGVRTLTIGGEVLTRTLCDRVYANRAVRRVLNMYGPTECTTACLVHEVRQSERGEPPLGRVIAGAQLSVRDPQGQPVPDGDAGELWVAGPGMGRGYVNRPELTAERYVTDPAASLGRRYRSGDLVRRVAGVYQFVGRIDDQVKIRGLRVELGEIRAALAAHPRVRVAAVLAPADPTGVRRLVAYVEPAVTAPGQPALSEEDLLAYLRDLLPAYMVPSRIAVLARIPLSPNGKIDRRALPPVDAVDPEHLYVAPRTDLERRLAQIVAQALGVSLVGLTDRFTERGGHSLAAARVVARLAAELGTPVSMDWFLGNPTVADLAGALTGAAGVTSDGGRSAGGAGVRRHHGLDSYPLTDMQRQLWTARQISPNKSVTMVAVRLGVDGLADAAPLRLAMAAVVDRHEVLRSVIIHSGADGQPRVQVRPAGEVPVDEHDLRGLGGEELRRRAAGIAERFARQPLDPGRDVPLLRAALIWTGSRRAEVVLAIDHVAVDGVSIALLMDELAAGIEAVRRGEDPGTAVPAPALQVGDIALAEAGATLEEARRFWREQLLGAVPPHDLPGRRRAGPPAHRGARITRPLGPDLLAALAGAAARVGATRSAALLAALAVLVDALTGRPDVLVGVAAAYRDVPGTERTIGPLMGVLPVRLRWEDDPSFATLAVRALAATRRALTHRAVPAADLAADAGVDRPAGSSLTPVVLSVHPDGDAVLVERGETRVELLGELGVGAAPNDLAVFVNNTVHGPQLQIEYDVDRFDHVGAQALADRYLRLLTDAAADPNRPVSGFDLVTPAEREWLLRVGTGPALPDHHSTVVPAVLEQATRDPRAVAVVGAGGSLSYAGLTRHADRVAAGLVELGARPDTAVGVCLPRDHLLPATVFGVLRSGAAYLPLDPDQPPERLRGILRDAGVPLVLTAPATAPAMAGLGVDVLDVAELVARDSPAELPAVEPGRLAYVLFTSGSTGRPKGVEVTHANLASFVAAIRVEAGYGPGDVVLAVSPLWFDISCVDLWVPLALGARIAITDRATALDGVALRAWLAETGVTAVDLPPTLLRMLVAAGWPGGATRVISGGEQLDHPLAMALLDRVPRLWNMYGPTETTVTATAHRVGPAPDAEDPIPIGGPIPGTRLAVRDRAGRLVPPGVIGELWIGGPGVARGYRGRPDLTAQAFVSDPAVPGGRCYQSGDLVRWRRDGVLEFVGRADDQVKVRGYRIELGEIESALHEHPSVAHAAVTVLAPGAPEAYLAGYVVPRPGRSIQFESLAEHLRQRVPDYMVPARWAELDRLPTTSGGKLDRHALPEPEPSRREAVPPRGPMEELIAEVWAEVLGCTGIGATDDFIRLGGHSLAAVRVVAELRDRLGADVPARALFVSPVLTDFAAEVERLALASLSDEIEVNR